MKLYVYIIAGILCMAAGSAITLGITKATRPVLSCPPAPPCNCPPATEVRLQSLEFDALRKVKGPLTVTNSMDHVTIYVMSSQDSARFIDMLKNRNQKK